MIAGNQLLGMLATLVEFPHGNYWQRFDSALDSVRRHAPEAAGGLARFAAQAGLLSEAELAGLHWSLFENAASREFCNRWLSFDETSPSIESTADRFSAALARLPRLTQSVSEASIRLHVLPAYRALQGVAANSGNSYAHLLGGIVLVLGNLLEAAKLAGEGQPRP